MSRPQLMQKKCRRSLESLIKSGESKISQEEARKLLNYLLLYSMIDTRVLLSEKIISDFHANESLLELIMTNWMDLISLKSMIHNVMVLRQPEFGGYYGGFRMTNQMFLEVLRIKLTKKTRKSLGMHLRSDRQLLEDMRILEGFFRGKYWRKRRLNNNWKSSDNKKNDD